MRTLIIMLMITMCNQAFGQVEETQVEAVQNEQQCKFAIPFITMNEVAVDTIVLTRSEVESRRYSYDEITTAFICKFKDGETSCDGWQEVNLKETIYNACYDCTENGNELYCEVYYYYNQNDNRLSNWEKRNIEDNQKWIEYYQKDGRIEETKEHERAIQSIKDTHVSIEYCRAKYIAEIMNRMWIYTGRVKYHRTSDIRMKNQILAVISNYKEQYRKYQIK